MSMIIFLREIRRNLKSAIIWTSVVVLMVVYMASLFPLLSDQAEEMTNLIKAYPEALVKAFNFDLMDFTDIINFFGSEPYIFWLLCGCIFAMILSGGILSKEESDKTIEFLLAKPVRRSRVVTAKLLNALFYIFAFNAIIFVSSIISIELLKKGDYSVKTVMLLTAGAFLAQLTFAAIGFFISVFIVKAKSIMPISIGVVLGAFFLNSVAGMSDKTENLKYLTPFKYVDARDILKNQSISGVYLIIIFCVVALSIGMSYYVYERKDIKN